MLVLTVASSDQKSLPKDDLQKKYEYYKGSTFPVHKLTFDESGSNTQIKNIIIGGTKRSGFMALVRGKSMRGITTYTIQLENAIEVGEIKTPGLSSDEALIELKKAKDKLDLQLISQSKYDSIKAVLIQYIK